MGEDKSIASALPISFKEFSKKPLTGILYLSLIVIGYLYIDIKVSYNKRDKERIDTIQLLVDKTDRLSTEVSFLREQVRRSDSALADVRATLKVLKEVGKIQ